MKIKTISLIIMIQAIISITYGADCQYLRDGAGDINVNNLIACLMSKKQFSEIKSQADKNNEDLKLKANKEQLERNSINIKTNSDDIITKAEKSDITKNKIDIEQNKQDIIANNKTNTTKLTNTLAAIPGMLKIAYTGNIIDGKCHGNPIAIATITHGAWYWNGIAGSSVYITVSDPLNNPSFVFLSKSSDKDTMPEGVAITTTPDKNDINHYQEVVVRYDGGLVRDGKENMAKPFSYPFWTTKGQVFPSDAPNGGYSYCYLDKKNGPYCASLTYHYGPETQPYSLFNSKDFTITWVAPNNEAPQGHIKFWCRS